MPTDSRIGGFGAYSANLLTFVMPSQSQTLLSPATRAGEPHQYEGYSYLGAGTLLLGVVVMLSALRAPRPALWGAVLRRRLPLIAALLFLAAMAVGPIVTLGSRVVASYDAGWWGPLTTFRSHGRMIWALHYALIAAIAFAATRFAPRTAVGLLAAAVAVQAVDVAGMRRDLTPQRLRIS